MTLEVLGDKEYGSWPTDTDGLGAGSIVYSFGVGTNISWDVEMIRRFGCRVWAYDPNPIAVSYLTTQTLPPQFQFEPVGIATFDGVQRFWGRPGKISTSTIKKIGVFTELPVRTLESLMRQNGHDHIDVLKLDVEGAEFPVVPRVASLPIRQLLVEIHTNFYASGLKGLRRLWGGYLTWRVVGSLKAAGFKLVNRRGQEYTFIRQ